MNQKKNKKILIILIIVLIGILISGAAIIYFVTDIFKSDKELFFKYISQVGDNKKGFISQDLTNYFEKRNNTPYNNQSILSFEIPEEYYKNTEVMDDFNITFSGQVDKKNNKISQNISLNYSDDTSFPINFRQVSNVIGIQTSYIGNKFIALDTNNSEKILKDQIPIDTIKDASETIQEIKDVELTEEQRNYIFNTYKDILDNNLSDQDFSKVQDGNLEGYKLSLEGEKLKNILIKLLENLKNDQITLDKINEYLKIYSNSSKISVSSIDKSIKNIENNSDFNDKKFDIIVYKKSGNVSKILISVDENSIAIEKTINGKNEELKLSIVIDGTLILNLTLNFEGLQSNQNVKENCEIEISLPKADNKKDVSTYKYKIYNDINFTNEATIEDLTDENSVMLANLSDEQLTNFINTVIDRIGKVNKQQMAKLKLKENENPIIYCIPDFTKISSSSKLFNEANISFGETSKRMSELEITTFNQKFELYEGKNSSGQTVKGLLSVISLNNEDEDNYRIKEINFNGQEYDATETNIAFIKGDIDLSKRYKIEFEKDENTGVIFRTIINEK